MSRKRSTYRPVDRLTREALDGVLLQTILVLELAAAAALGALIILRSAGAPW